jgi:DNA-binding NarL/FixJ family response regulator
VGELTPDVVLVSTDFGGAGCVDAIESLLAVNPEATVVMLSSRGDKNLVHAGMRAGATGSLDRDASPGETITALHVHRRRHLGEDIDLALAEPEADGPALRVSGSRVVITPEPPRRRLRP